MSQLDTLQAAMARAIVAGDASRLAGTIAGDGLSPERRLQIHQNHYRTTLTDALAATFPVVARLVGESCFAAAAYAYILRSPPKSPCLFEYGSGFPFHLATLPGLEALRYLPDVARLEWAINHARHAPDAAHLGIARFARLPQQHYRDLVLGLHPACQLVASRFPIDRIWHANQEAAPSDGRIDLDGGGVRLLVHRDAADDVAWLRLVAADHLFLRMLRAGRSIGEAWTAATHSDADFDGVTMLAVLIDAGVLTDPELQPTPAMR